MHSVLLRSIKRDPTYAIQYGVTGKLDGEWSLQFRREQIQSTLDNLNPRGKLKLKVSSQEEFELLEIRS